MAVKNLSIPVPDGEDLIGIAKTRGRKLGILIAAANMPDEIKEALITLLPYFSLEQLDRLTTIFEIQYYDEQAEKLAADKLIKELGNISEEYRKSSDGSAEEARMKIEALAKKITEQ